MPRLVSLISHDMTLEPGDVFLCGTSVGVGSMKPGQTVEVEIEGIGLADETVSKLQIEGLPMKIAIIGAGAIGGYVGVKLALAGEDLTFIVRGANLEAIRKNGMKLVMHDGTEHVARNVKATNDYAAAGVQDLVILAMKAHQLEAVVDDLPKLIGPQTLIVHHAERHPLLVLPPARRRAGRQRGQERRPDAFFSPRRSRASQVIGCVVYPASELIAPGVVQAHRGRPLPGG